MVKTKKQKQAVIDEALKRFERAEEAWREIYEKALADIRFVDEEDEQWDRDARDKRKGQPCLTFDKISGAIDQIVGDHLQNKPGIKVVGAEDDDADTAEIYEGLIRQIEGRGNRAYKTAFKMAVRGGWGAWRIRHDYVDSDSFDQDLILDEIKNPFSVLLDPIIQTSDVTDARYGFIFEDIPVDEFEDMYPKAKSGASETFDTTGNMQNWINTDYVRVAEYFRLVSEDRELGLTQDGQVLFVDEYPETEFVKTRSAKVDRLECFKITACEVLEEVKEIGQYIPIIPLFGKTSNVDGKLVTRGVIRKARDAQKLYNYERSAYVESVALQPKNPFFFTPKMVKGHEEKWRNFNVSNEPGIPYNPDPESPTGMPKREPPPQMSPGLVQGMQISADDIKAATGIYDASLGQRSNETSGRAIRARQQEGDTANFEFTDEFAEAIRHTGKILIDLIPEVYDAQRQIRILGEDDAEEVMEINKPVFDYVRGEWKNVNDLSRGNYDVKIRVGPSYATRRIETSEQIGQIIAQNPEMGQIIMDIYFQSLDLVGADEAVKRVRKMLIKKGIAEPTDEEKQEMMNPQAMKQKQMATQMKQRAAQAELAKREAEVEEKRTKSQVEKGKLQLDMAKFQAEQREDFVFDPNTGTVRASR